MINIIKCLPRCILQCLPMCVIGSFVGSIFVLLAYASIVVGIIPLIS